MGTQSQAYTNSVPYQQSLYPECQHTLAFYIKCVLSVGLAAGVRYSAATSFLQYCISLAQQTAFGQILLFWVCGMLLLVLDNLKRFQLVSLKELKVFFLNRLKA